MMSKKIMAAALTGAVCMSVLTACGSTEEGSVSKNSSAPSGETSNNTVSQTEESKPEDTKDPALHTLRIIDGDKNSAITACFFNTQNDKKVDVPMTRTEETEDYVTFSCEGDPKQYNMVKITYDNDSTSKSFAFNRFTDGWYMKKSKLLPYTDGMDLKYDPTFETKDFTFDGYNRRVYIWTPKDYDKNAEEKYSTIYLFDGQTVLATGIERGMESDTDCWNVSENVEAMMSVTDNKTILVCITNGDQHRDDELVPDLGEMNRDDNIGPALESNKRGNDFADFICDTIVPYVQENYNVHKDPQHTALAGSSLGGLECFYAVMSHPEHFGTAGILSSSFWLYKTEVWKDFIKDKVKMENAPFLYFYAGSFSSDNGDMTEDVYNLLLEAGYPKEKLVFNKVENGQHMPLYWRNIFPEFLQAVFTQDVEALECGVPVKYKDRRTLEDYPMNVPVESNDPGLKDPNNFIYFDNSSVKWDKVFAYWWDGIPQNKINGCIYLNDWPGMEMEQIEGTDIYRLIMPMGPSMIVFSSGITDAEVMNGTIAYQTADMPYDDIKNAGQIFVIDPNEEPKTKTAKTKYFYSSGEWKPFEQD